MHSRCGVIKESSTTTIGLRSRRIHISFLVIFARVLAGWLQLFSPFLWSVAEPYSAWFRAVRGLFQCQQRGCAGVRKPVAARPSKQLWLS